MKYEPAATKVTADELRTRYNALGAERVFFGVAAGGTLLGALLPIVQTPLMFFLPGSAMRFYNLGTAGWLLFAALVVLVGTPLIRPALIAGRRAVPLVALAGAIIGVLLTLFSVASYGFFSVGPGAYAWLIAAAALVAGYARRIR